jgi:hypothetical protein
VAVTIQTPQAIIHYREVENVGLQTERERKERR